MTETLRLQERNVPYGGGKYQGEVVFCRTEEAVKKAIGDAGKVLLFSDEQSYRIFTAAACSPRTVTLVDAGDCLPLFSLPDGISRVAATGGGKTLRSARAFAGVRRIPCFLLPSSLTAEGVAENSGEVTIGRNRITLPLSPATVFCDCTRLAHTRGAAFATLLLHRIEAFGKFSVERISGENAAFDGYSPLPGGEDGKALFSRCLQAGGLKGDGAALCRMLSRVQEPQWQAFLQLSALYAAFVERGKPRRYFVPDYRARAKRAATVCPHIPTLAQYTARAMAFERSRGALRRAISPLIQEKKQYGQTMRVLCGEITRSGDLSALRQVAEHSPDGLCAIIRDFGLAEWEDSDCFNACENV